VIVLDVESAPETDVVNANVTGTPALFTNRSEFVMLNPTEVTDPAKPPDGVLSEVKGS